MFTIAMDVVVVAVIKALEIAKSNAVANGRNEITTDDLELAIQHLESKLKK